MSTTVNVSSTIALSDLLNGHHANNSLLYIKLDKILKDSGNDKCIHISMNAKISDKQQNELTPTNLKDKVRGKLYRPIDGKVVWWIKNKSIKEFLDESYFNNSILLNGTETIRLEIKSWDGSSTNLNVESECQRLTGYNERFVGDGNTLCALAGINMSDAAYYLSDDSYPLKTRSVKFSVNDKISVGYVCAGYNQAYITIYNETEDAYMIESLYSYFEGYRFEYYGGYPSLSIIGRINESDVCFVLGFGLENVYTSIWDSKYSDKPLLLGFNNLYRSTRSINNIYTSLSNTETIKLYADNSPNIGARGTFATTWWPFYTTIPEFIMPFSTISSIQNGNFTTTIIDGKPEHISGNAYIIDSIASTNVLLSMNNKDGQSLSARCDNIIIKSKNFKTSNDILDLDKANSYIFDIDKSTSYKMNNNENIKLFANSMPKIVMYNPYEESISSRTSSVATVVTAIVAYQSTVPELLRTIPPILSTTAILPDLSTTQPSIDIGILSNYVDIIDMNEIDNLNNKNLNYNIFIILSKTKNKMLLLISKPEGKISYYKMENIYNISLLSLIRTAISDNPEVIKETSDSEKYINSINMIDLKDFIINELENDNSKIKFVNNILNNNP